MRRPRLRGSLVGLFAILLASAAPAQEVPPPRILVVGDSWAAGIVGFRAFEKVFTAYGIDDVGVAGRLTAIGGSRADEWAVNQGGKLDRLTAQLEELPTLDAVHVSIGGNDFLKATMEGRVIGRTPEERDALWQEIWANIEVLLRHIREQRPDVRILLNGYDFLNPEQMHDTFDLAFPEAATPEATNEALVEFSRFVAAKCRETELCAFQAYFGLLRNHLIKGQYEVDPTQRLSVIPLAELDDGPFAPNPLEVMPDGVHPSVRGYDLIIQYAFEAHYRDWLGIEEPAPAVEPAEPAAASPAG